MALYTVIRVITEVSRRCGITQAEKVVPKSSFPMACSTDGHVHLCTPSEVLTASCTVTWAAGHEGTLLKSSACFFPKLRLAKGVRKEHFCFRI